MPTGESSNENKTNKYVSMLRGMLRGKEKKKRKKEQICKVK